MHVRRTGFEGPLGLSGRRLAVALVLVFALVSAVVVFAVSGVGETQSATVPSRPSGLSAMVASSSEVVLSWSDPGDDSITGYQYQLSKNPTSLSSAVWGSWTSVPSSDADTVSYKVTGLDSGTYYLFRVRAQSVGGNSRASNAVSATTTAATTTTVVPPGLSVVWGSSSAVLSWPDPGDDSITGYQYQMSKGFSSWMDANWGSWMSVPGSDADTVSYKVTGLDSRTYYLFQVRAQSVGDNSRFLGLVGGYTTLGVPSMPSGLSVVWGSSSAVLSWSDPGDDSITGYQYQMSKGFSSWMDANWGSWMSVPGSDADTVSYKVTGLDSGTYYLFRVRAQSVGGNSRESFVDGGYTSSTTSQPGTTATTSTVLPPRVHLPGEVGSSATDTRVVDSVDSRSVMAVVRVVVSPSVSVGGSSLFRDPDGAYLGSDPSVGAVLATSFKVSAFPVDGSAADCRVASTNTQVDGNGTFTRNDDMVVAYLSVVKESGPSGRVCSYDILTGLPVGFVAASAGSAGSRVGSYVLSPATKLVADGSDSGSAPDVVTTSAADCGKSVVTGLGADSRLGSSDDVKATVTGPLCLTHSVKVATRDVYVTQSVTGDPGGGSARYSLTEGRSCGTSGHAASPSTVTLHEGYFNITESVLGPIGAVDADGRFRATRHVLNYRAEPCVVTVAVSELPEGCAAVAATQKRNLATSEDAANRVVMQFDITCPNTTTDMVEDTDIGPPADTATDVVEDTDIGPPADTPTG